MLDHLHGLQRASAEIERRKTEAKEPLVALLQKYTSKRPDFRMSASYNGVLGRVSVSVAAFMNKEELERVLELLAHLDIIQHKVGSGG